MTTFTIIEIPGPPVACPRPRVPTRGKAYYSERFTDHLETIAILARQEHLGKPPLLGPVAIELWFYGAHHSADPDNLAKTVLDGLVRGGVLVNDTWSVIRKLEIQCHPPDSEENGPAESPRQYTHIQVWPRKVEDFE